MTLNCDGNLRVNPDGTQGYIDDWDPEHIKLDWHISQIDWEAPRDTPKGIILCIVGKR